MPRAAAAWGFDERGRVPLTRQNSGGRRFGPLGGGVESSDADAVPAPLPNLARHSPADARDGRPGVGRRVELP
ncbi:MAG: hypothetical protein ICV64_11325 [Thermoleophilia bacterium]|nr:hypothetical protein [Thermoleophilia bacterium]